MQSQSEGKHDASFQQPTTENINIWKASTLSLPLLFQYFDKVLQFFQKTVFQELRVSYGLQL